MSYVDLNPIRAGLAATPAASAFTSIQQRIQERAQEGEAATPAAAATLALPLAPLQEKGTGVAAAFERAKYLRLVDWAGGAVRPGERGAIDEALAPILQRLGIEAHVLLEHLGQGRGG